MLKMKTTTDNPKSQNYKQKRSAYRRSKPLSPATQTTPQDIRRPTVANLNLTPA